MCQTGNTAVCIHINEPYRSTIYLVGFNLIGFKLLFMHCPSTVDSLGSEMKKVILVGQDCTVSHKALSVTNHLTLGQGPY